MDYIKITEQKIKDIVLKYFADEPVEVFLFGSRAGDKHKYNSDFDIGLITSTGQPVNNKKYLDAVNDLDQNILIKVDLVDFSTKDDIFKQVALKNRIVWKTI